MALVDPLDLGTRHLRNRLVFGPHATNLGRRRAISDRHVAYYARRAAGGVGLIVTEEASVHPLDWPYERAPLAADCVPGWVACVEACHTHGAVVVAAIGHNGLQGSSAYSQRETWAPTRVADAVTRELPKEMESSDIADVLAGFAQAARSARSAGLDGVEVNAGQHSLLRQFLSGLTNQRGDEWGAGDSGRSRFAKQVLIDVRAALGHGAILGLRLSCDELAPWAGITPDAALDIAAELAPLVDYLVVVRGSIYSTDATTPDCHTPPGFNLDLARQVAERVRGLTVVMAQGSVVDPAQAADALADGTIGLLEMTRAQIADPDLANRVVSGRGDTVRPCLLCNQRCRVRDSRNPIVTCTVNPSAGYESDDQDSDTVALGRVQGRVLGRVHIVGAGPAGLETARLLASLGADVSVYDRRDRPGGIVPDWARASGRERLGVLIPWLFRRCEDAGVTFEFAADIGPQEIVRWGDDTVVLCTGGTDRALEYAVTAGATVLSSLESLQAHSEGRLADGNVAIWDPIGGPIGISLAETFAPAAAVTLITPDLIPGTMLSLSGDLAAASTRLHRLGVTLLKRRRLRSVDGRTLTIQDVHTGELTQIEADTVVDAGHRVADDTLWQSSGRRLLRAGDAVAPRTIYEAILEGRRLARRVVEVSSAAAAPVGHR